LISYQKEKPDMNRRHFVSLSGTSLLALCFTRWQDRGIDLINLPDQVLIQTADQWMELRSNGSGDWVWQDSRIRLQHGKAELSVLAEFPGRSLQAIRLIWKYRIPAQSSCLGDHWERSYGDLAWRSPSFERKAPWYILVSDGKQTQCFGMKTGPSSIAYWQLDERTLQLTMDTRSGGNGVQLGDRVLHSGDIISLASQPGESPFETGRRFCRMMCSQPRLPALPVYGINDWYFAYGNNSKELILQHTGLMTDLATSTANRPFSVIDAGWALKSPLAPDDCCWSDDFSRPNQKFGDMSVLAAKIKEMGMRPGLWVRPLSAHHLEPASGLAPVIKGREDSKSPILDPTLPENLDRIQSLIRLYSQWGFEMVKHDYTSFDIFGRWGFQMTDGLTEGNWHFHEVSKTNAEIILDIYRAIREAAEGIYLIGCNTMSHLSAGFFELNRIGDDTSGQDWQRTRKMGVNTLGFRIIQHEAFYAADADCVGITDHIPWTKNKQWMDLLAESGTPLFLSAQPGVIGKEQKDAIRNSFSLACSAQPPGEPLDWFIHPFPSQWNLNGRKTEFNWD
jgi:alpha-galactosidase